MLISSVQNQRIKKLRKLDKYAERRRQQLFVVEGLREICLAVRGGYVLRELYVCQPLVQENENYHLNGMQVNERHLITEEVYRSLAYRESTEGVLGIFEMITSKLADLRLPQNPLILVIEGVEKPGNLGAMLRTCDAAAVDAVILCDTKTDLYNPNVIRSSMGTLFTNQVVVGTTQEVQLFLQQKNIRTYAAELLATASYHEQNFQESTAIVVGAEATGLSEAWIKACDKCIKIPMFGKIDSLNVSVSAAVLLYEARRQRMFSVI